MSWHSVVLLADGELGAFAAWSILAFLVPVIAGAFVAATARSRIERERRATAMLSHDLLLHLKSGDIARAEQMARSQDAPLALGFLRLMSVNPSNRTRVATDIEENWERELWHGGESAVVCLLWGSGIVAALFILLSGWMLIAMEGGHGTADVHIVLGVVTVTGALIVFAALRDFRRSVREAREKLCAFHAAEIRKIREAMEALPPAPP